MRLKGKITTICIVIMVLVMSGCFVVILQIQEKSLRDTDDKNAEKSLAIYCSNIIPISSTASMGMQETTVKSVVAYYFSTYARLAQTENIYYSLVSDGKYLYDMSPYDPYSVLPKNNFSHSEETKVSIQRIRDGKNIVIVGCYPFQISNQNFEAYISMNVHETENKIVGLRILCIFLLIFGCMITAVITVLLVRHILSPIEKLTQNAVSISKGDYHLRTNYKSKDEIGILSVAFDKMSESIEEKITCLDIELQKQQLLLGALSHEMKTPMTALIGYADSLLRMPLNEAQKNECARKIYHAGSLMESLTQKMMELVGMSDIEQIKKETIDSTVFLEDLRELISREVGIYCDVDKIFGDKTLLLSMVMNLVENAMRASGDTPQVSVQITNKDGFTQIIVSDKGCGIAEDQIPLITEPFYRVDKARSRKYGGTGLGLAICKRICECHNGTLSIESKVGEGTTVTAHIITN